MLQGDIKKGFLPLRANIGCGGRGSHRRQTFVSSCIVATVARLDTLGCCGRRTRTVVPTCKSDDPVSILIYFVCVCVSVCVRLSLTDETDYPTPKYRDIKFFGGTSRKWTKEESAVVNMYCDNVAIVVRRRKIGDRVHVAFFSKVPIMSLK